MRVANVKINLFALPRIQGSFFAAVALARVVLRLPRDVCSLLLTVRCHR